MDNKDYLGKTLEIKIDRPFGTKHPKHGFIYPVNYGYVPNTVSGDGKEYSDDAINALTEFQEQYFEHVIIRK